MGVLSYEKSQMLLLRQLAQSDPLSFADRSGGGPPLPPSPLGIVLSRRSPGPWLRDLADAETIDCHKANYPCLTLVILLQGLMRHSS